MGMCYQTINPPGATTAPIWSKTASTGGNAGWVAFQYALRPAGTTGAQEAVLQKNYVATLGLGAGNDLVGFYDFLDAGATVRYLAVDEVAGIIRSAAGGGTPDAVVQALATSSTRTILQTNGAGVFWLMIPDLGIYRSTDYCATWTLWWTKAIGSQDYRWSGHIARDFNDVNTLWVTFENGGVWKVPSAHTAAVGSGTAGSVPTGAAKVTGGSLPLGTERMGPICVDGADGTVWVIQHPGAVKTAARIHKLIRGTGSTWIEEVDSEIAEGAQLAQGISAYAGQILVMTNGQGTLRRVC